jgi:hypothetical protein
MKGFIQLKKGPLAALKPHMAGERRKRLKKRLPRTGAQRSSTQLIARMDTNKRR